MKGENQSIPSINDLMINSIEEAIFLVSFEGGKFLFAKSNPAFSKLVGAKEDIVGKTLQELMGEEASARIEANYKHCIEQKRPMTFEETLIRNSREQILHTTVVPVSHNSKTYILGSSIDITEMRSAEEHVRRNLMQSEILIDVLQHRSDNIQEYLDYALSQLLNLTESKYGYIYFYDEIKKEFTLNTWSIEVMQSCKIRDKLTVYHLEKTGIWGEAVRQRKPIMVNEFAAPNSLKKGYPEGHVSLERFLTIPVFDADSIVAVVGVSNKETEYDDNDVMNMQIFMNNVWKVVDRIRSERKYRAMFDQSASGICMCTLEGKYIDANKTFCDMVGYSLGELKQMTFRDITFPEDIEKSNDYFKDMVSAGSKNEVIEKRYRKKDGSICYVNISGSVVDDANSAQPYAVITVQDITDRKKLEDQKLVIEAKLRNQQKLESIGTLAGGVAHEINNPINGVINYGQLILDCEPHDEIKQYAQEIIKESDRISAIVSNLLQFSRQETRMASPCRINDVINDTIMLTKTLIKDDQIDLDIDIAENLPDVRCISQQIQQVIMNLLTNARDELNEKYKGYHENKRIYLICSELIKNEQKWVRVCVKDNGRGIPEDVQSKIFDPFFTTKGRYRGTGLGLAISYGIVKDHLGELSFKTKQGEGTEFFLDLPLYTKPDLD